MSSTGTRTTPPSSAYAVFGALTGLTALGVLLQGLWAGLFLRGGDQQSWVEVHGLGANVTLVLALLTAGWAVWKLRSRRELVVGSVVLLLLLVGEAVLGGLIADAGKDDLTALHVPLAVALMGLAVWLPLRARAGRR